ncbi:hypothetical protein [Nocardia wallacei]|uniref:Uncharacterized protein n=1 Tax=Nocardia wallacei TaxID=480035 RepID=A0A7G1KQL7_9NOCA|nr:hypothetical protein [Nocardia wallacei]BCK57517.1 hypothetical protein NWFMUON74_52890 [Nocardia wallacei]
MSTARRILAGTLVVGALTVVPATIAPAAFAAPGGSTSGNSENHSGTRNGGTRENYSSDANGTGFGDAGGTDAQTRRRSPYLDRYGYQGPYRQHNPYGSR